jgi:hypothetical protein
MQNTTITGEGSMKKVKLDALDKMRGFEDTPQVVVNLRQLGLLDEANHLANLWTVAKKLAAEVRKSRKGQNGNTN